MGSTVTGVVKQSEGQRLVTNATGKVIPADFDPRRTNGKSPPPQAPCAKAPTNTQLSRMLPSRRTHLVTDDAHRTALSHESQHREHKFLP